MPSSNDPDLTVRLLGPARVHIRGFPAPAPRSQKVLWLLGLLCLNHSSALTRSWLAGQMWPDADEERALCSLRTALHDLRRLLGADSWRITAPTSRTLRFDLEGAEVDVCDFDRAIGEGRHADAVSAYGGEFLTGCIEDWAIQARAARECAFLSALDRQIEKAVDSGRSDEAIQLLRRAISLDPLRESMQSKLMELYAEAGDRASAIQVYRELRLLLRRELNVEPGPEATRAYKSIRERVIPTLDGTVNQQRPAHKIGRLPPMFGREEHLALVGQLLRDSPLTTLTGPGGIGKTRLALAAAKEFGSAFADGAVFIRLEEARESESVLRVILDSLSLRETPEGSSGIALHAFLRERRMLLVLDNCEHVLEMCVGLVRDLIHAAPTVRILATSREPLHLSFESIVPVPPLALPGADRHTDAEREPIEQSAAVKLFLARGRCVRPEFTISPENRTAIARICRRLDGIPLAIELAASRLNALCPQQILELLNARMLSLRSEYADDSARHRTLKASLDWSYLLLSRPKQTLFIRLGVFSGHFRLHDVAAICWNGGAAEHELVDTICSLVDRSMITVTERGVEACYRLLEPVRDYACAVLAESDDLGRLRDRHACYYLELARKGRDLSASELPKWFEEIDLTHADVLSSLSWASTSSREGASVTRAAHAVLGLNSYWSARGFMTEGRAWVDRVLSLDSVCATDRADLLWVGATMAVYQGDCDCAQRMAEDVARLDLAPMCDSRAAHMFLALSQASMLRGKVASAMQYNEKAVTAARESGDSHAESLVFTSMGHAAAAQGDFATARAFYQRSLKYNLERGDARGIAWALDNLADVAVMAEDWVSAATHYSLSLSAFRGLDDLPGIAACMHGLAATAILRAEPIYVEDATTLYGSADRIYREMEAPPYPIQDRLLRPALERARDLVGDNDFGVAWARGSEISTSEAIERAGVLMAALGAESIHSFTSISQEYHNAIMSACSRASHSSKPRVGPDPAAAASTL